MTTPKARRCWRCSSTIEGATCASCFPDDLEETVWELVESAPFELRYRAAAEVIAEWLMESPKLRGRDFDKVRSHVESWMRCRA